jgi:hypothetical protein
MQYCNTLHMYILSVRDVALFGMDSRIACAASAPPCLQHPVVSSSNAIL